MEQALIPLTSALEDYLETIYRLVQSRSFARVKDIARERNVKAGSVSPALKRLKELGLVDYQRREYVELTSSGERHARRIYARHQLLTRFFEEVLQMEGKEAEEQACAMEHSLSNEGMDRLARFFEYLSTCPSSPDFLRKFSECPVVNDDAPGCQDAACKQCCGEEAPMSIASLKPGEKANITQLSARGAIRQRLLDMGILPGTQVTLERVAPTGDPVWIRIAGTELALRKTEAASVKIER